MRIGLLGPVTAGPDDMPAPGGVLLRGALARLALDAGRSVSSEALVDALWGAEPPDTVTNALQALVARLRRALGADVVATVPGGYRLAVDRRDVDALRAESLVARGPRRSIPAQARALLVEATALWRGPALADVRRLPFAEAAAVRLEELRATAVELSAEAALRLGEPGAELDALRRAAGRRAAARVHGRRAGPVPARRRPAGRGAGRARPHPRPARRRARCRSRPGR